MNFLSVEDKQFVCISAILEDEFKALDEGRDYRYGKAYIGSTGSAFRSYPTTKQYDGYECADYDPRFRPWYVTATSGAKNVILIIATSASMLGDGLEVPRTAAKAVINTLSNNDFLGVISFGTSARTVYTSQITRATIDHRWVMEQEIDKLEFSGLTNYQAAFGWD